MAASLRTTPDAQRARDWALALASAGIDARIDPDPEGYAVVVAPGHWLAADRVLAAYDSENRPAPAPAAEESDAPVSSRAALVVAALLCAAFVVTGPRERGAWWFERGAAVAWRILDGEVWRTVTALTLHADFPHILGNAAALAIFGSALCGLLGAGTGLWVLLLSGALGNFLNASLRGTAHSAVGASTAIFGAIGALATLQLIRRRRGARVSIWGVWAPVAAGLALLGFLGTAPHTDVLAHLFGFAVGAVLGVAASPVAAWRNEGRLQQVLAAGAAATVLICWLLASGMGVPSPASPSG